MTRPFRLGCLLLALATAACSQPSGGRQSASALRPGVGPSGSTVVSGDLTTTSLAAVPDEKARPASPGRQLAARGQTSTAVPGQAEATPTATTQLQARQEPAGFTLPPEKCPQPKTCRRYRYHDGNPLAWRAGPDGWVTIPYWVNVENLRGMDPSQAEGAIQAAFATWDRVVPQLHHVYNGRTSRLAVSGDGTNVVDFNNTVNYELTSFTADGDHLVEFDTTLSPDAWVWAPCGGADGSCTPYRETTPGPGGAAGFVRVDLQSTMTHAVGHTLGLADMRDADVDRELTMFPGDADDLGGSRHWSTLALGDVLGVCSLYHCDTLPPIYDP